MADPKIVREWLDKADEDSNFARINLEERDNFYPQICFHFHQATEKYLKSFIGYDSSTFDTDPFEPQPDGVGTIFPFWVPGNNGKGFVELPYTLPQDFTLFVLMGEKDIDIWKRKLDWIAEKQ